MLCSIDDSHVVPGDPAATLAAVRAALSALVRPAVLVSARAFDAAEYDALVSSALGREALFSTVAASTELDAVPVLSFVLARGPDHAALVCALEPRDGGLIEPALQRLPLSALCALADGLLASAVAISIGVNTAVQSAFRARASDEPSDGWSRVH